MATSQIQKEVQSKAIELAGMAFEQFCEDISGMFGIELECDTQDVQTETSATLNKKFKKLSGLISFKAEGVMDGNFHIILDRAGVFTLSGVMVMLPKQQITKNGKHGSIKEAEEMSDAFGEAGNLLVGSWDRIFREDMEDHGHFVQSGTLFDDSWGKTKEAIELEDDEEFSYIPCTLTVGEYPDFQCGIILPDSIFNGEKASATEAEEEKDEETTQENTEEAVEAVEETAEIPETPENTQETENKEEGTEIVGEIAEETSQEPEVTEEVEVTETAIEADETKDEPKDPEPQAAAGVSENIQKMVSSPATLPGVENVALQNIYAKDIMRTDVIWAVPDDSIRDATKKIQQNDIGYLLIGSDNKIDGIVSGSDVNSAVSVYLKPIFSKWRRPIDDATMQIKLKWIMSKLVYTAGLDESVSEIVAKMCRHKCRAMPIVDSQGKTLGIITAFEVFMALANSTS